MAAERHLRALEAALARPVTLGEAASKLSGTGLGLALILFCLPFLQPLPVGGLSSVLGPCIALQGLQLALGRTILWMPDWLARRRLEPRARTALLDGARRLLELVGRFCRPRWRALARAERAAGLGIAFNGALLSLPFPIPLSNALCAAPICLLCLAMLEEDGLLAALGWAGVGVAAAFHFGVFALGAEGLWMLGRGAFG